MCYFLLPSVPLARFQMFSGHVWDQSRSRNFRSTVGLLITHYTNTLGIINSSKSYTSFAFCISSARTFYFFIGLSVVIIFLLWLLSLPNYVILLYWKTTLEYIFNMFLKITLLFNNIKNFFIKLKKLNIYVLNNKYPFEIDRLFPDKIIILMEISFLTWLSNLTF